jgi:hypothetical protein
MTLGVVALIIVVALAFAAYASRIAIEHSRHGSQFL